MAGFIDATEVALARFAVGGGQFEEAPVAELEEPAVEGGDREIAVRAPGEAADQVAGPAFRCLPTLPGCSRPAYETSVSADPQTASAIGVEVHDTGAGQFRCVARVEESESGAIEAEQPVERADPEVSVRGLGQRGGGVFRQAVRRFPAGHDIIGLLEVDGGCGDGRPNAQRRRQKEPDHEPSEPGTSRWGAGIGLDRAHDHRRVYWSGAGEAQVTWAAGYRSRPTWQDNGVHFSGTMHLKQERRSSARRVKIRAGVRPRRRDRGTSRLPPGDAVRARCSRR